MPRPKKHSRDEIIQLARACFWQYGFSSLGIRALEEETGIGRFAIRTEFGGKEGLFVEVLKSYQDRREALVLTPLRADGTLEGLVHVLERFVSPEKNEMGRFGCLYFNTTVENGTAQQGPVKEELDRQWGILRDVLTAHLDKLQKAGKVKEDLRIEDAVDFLVGAFLAINLINRERNDVKAGRGFVAMATETVRGWAPSSEP